MLEFYEASTIKTRCRPVGVKAPHSRRRVRRGNTAAGGLRVRRRASEGAPGDEYDYKEVEPAVPALALTSTPHDIAERAAAAVRLDKMRKARATREYWVDYDHPEDHWRL